MRAIWEAYAGRLRAAYAELARSGRVLCDVALVCADGSLLLDPDTGLPGRIDFIVVSGEPGAAGESETVQIVSEADDPPGVTGPAEPALQGAGVRAGGYELGVGPGRWDALSVEVRFAAPLSEGAQRDLVHLLHAWYLCGFFGGYGGEGRGCLHSMRDLRVGGDRAALTVDLGSTALRALEALLELLDAFGAEVARIAEVCLGAPRT